MGILSLILRCFGIRTQVYDGTENQDDNVDIDIDIDQVEAEVETGVNDGALINQDENDNGGNDTVVQNGNNDQSNQVLPQTNPWSNRLSSAIMLNQNQGPAILQMDQMFSNWNSISEQWAPPEDQSAESYSKFFSMLVRNCCYVYSGLAQIDTDLQIKYGVGFGDFSNGKAKKDFGSFISNIRFQDSNYGIKSSTYQFFIADIYRHFDSLTLLHSEISMFIDYYHDMVNGIPIQFHYIQSLLSIFLLRLDESLRNINPPFDLDRSIVSTPHYQLLFSQVKN